MEKKIRFGAVLHRLSRWAVGLALSAALFLVLPSETSAVTHELYISPSTHYTVSVGDTLNMSTLYTDTDDFDWFIGDNEEKALELEGSRSGRSVTFHAVAPGVVTVNCNRTVKTTVSKPYQYYNVYTNEWETRYNVVTESTSYDCICIITIEDNLAPEIMKQPSGMAAGSGQIASASVEASDHSTLSYQWFEKDPDSPVFKKSSGTGSTYSFVMSDGLSGRQAYCVITDSKGNSTISDTVTFSQITISKQPVSVTEEEGKPVSISVRASGSGLKYQWYIRSSDDRTYTKSAITSSSYSCTMTATKNGRQLYCVITDSYGNSVKTNQVYMNLAVYAAITEQPSDAAVGSGKKISTTVTAIGDGLTYQWYVKNPGADRFIKSSVTNKTYSYTMSSDKSGRQVYCIVKDRYGTSVRSQTVTLSLLAITKQPSSTSVDAGETITVSCKAEGSGVKYQWYVKNPGRSSFSKSSVTGSTYSYRMTADKSGRQVYCVATDTYGNSVKTKTVTLRMHIYAKILTEPKSVRVVSGETASVSVKAEGDGLTYQWYVASAGVKKYTKSSVTKSSYSITMSEEKSGRKAYCVITDKYGTSVRTKTVTLNMAAPLQIVTDLLPTYAYPGEEASMTVEATGQGELHYTWYTRKSSKDQWEKTSVEGNTYSIVMNEELSGMSVYCVITDNYGQRATTWSRAFTMIRELTITQQLEDVRASYNDGTALFWVRVEGTSYNLLEYEWYYTRPKDGGVYSKQYTGSKPSIEFDTVPANKGLSVYCVITDQFGQSVTSEEAYLYLYN